MSNTSYSFKENSHMKVIQGGEKKVMKKILSVALSTAMAFSMFASVAFGADAKLSPEQQFNVLKDAGIVTGYPDGTAGLDKSITRAELAKVIVKSINLEPVTGVATYKDKNYTASHWAAPFIEAATQAGILEGKNLEKKLFDPTGNVTVQELAKVLVAALKLEVPAETNNTATEWAKGYVEAAVKAGYLEAGINYQANATRAQAVVAAHAIYEVNNFKVVKAEASDATHVKLTLSTGEVVDVVLEKALEANKATELTYKAADGRELKYTVTYVVTTATKVEKVSASNLKEAVVAFDGEVDQDSAEEVSNYSLKSGKAITSASLSDDKKTVTLTLTGTLANNKADFLSVSNVKAGDKVISATNVEFTAVDNQLPEVTEVKSLGTKSVKVVFSEPVRLPAQTSFELDGKNYFGKITQPTSRTVILSPYNTTALAVGAHKLVIGSVYDEAGFKSLNSTHEITVVEDKDAPTITEAKATLESVTITFSEEVDVDTISASNVYWKSGSDKKTAKTFSVVSDNKIKFSFERDNSLPTGAIPIYVDGVKDYSGNQIAKDTSVIVNPEIDTTRPEVKKVVAEDSKTIKITFSKALLAKSVEKANFTILNKDGKVVSVKDAKLSGDVVTLDLYSDLSTGDNTLTIKNLKDNTRLENTMLDYSGKVNVADVAQPKVDSILFNKADKVLIIGFDKQMDPESLQNLSNYHIKVGSGTSDSHLKPLTNNIADITVFNDSNAVAIKFAEDVTFGTKAKEYSELFLMALKDTKGNLLKNYTANNGYSIDLLNEQGVKLATYDTDVDKAVYGDYSAALVDKNTIEVKFSAGISSASKDAFTVTGGTYDIQSIELNGTSVVKLKFKDDVLSTSTTGLKVEVNGKLTTLGGDFTVTKDTTILDKVAPELDKVVVNGNQIVATFSEGIVLDAAYNNVLLAKDFEITRYSDNKQLVAGNQYTVDLGADGKSVVITLNDAREVATEYTVKFLGSKYLTDGTAKNNEAKSFDKVTTKVAK